MHCTFTVQRDKAKESVSGYELRIKKYIEELKVASSKASESEAAMGKLRVEMSESRKTVNEVLHSTPLSSPYLSSREAIRSFTSIVCASCARRRTRCASRSYASNWRPSSASSLSERASSSSR